MHGNRGWQKQEATGMHAHSRMCMLLEMSSPKEEAGGGQKLKAR
jgi:hypothetical protein